MNRPDETLPTSRMAELKDEQIAELLDDLCSPEAATGGDAARVAAIIELECEVSRRGLQLPGAREPMPAALALRAFKRTIEQRDWQGCTRFMPYLDPAGLWFAYCRAREAEYFWRAYLLKNVLFCVETGVLGYDAARQRFQRVLEADLSADDLDRYLELCIGALFGVVITRLGLPY
jgi:hypothetical protein